MGPLIAERVSRAPSSLLDQYANNESGSKGDVPKYHRTPGQDALGIAELDRSCRRRKADSTVKKSLRKPPRGRRETCRSMQVFFFWPVSVVLLFVRVGDFRQLDDLRGRQKRRAISGSGSP
jgi:hypothetical protein